MKVSYQNQVYSGVLNKPSLTLSIGEHSPVQIHLKLVSGTRVPGLAGHGCPAFSATVGRDSEKPSKENQSCYDLNGLLELTVGLGKLWTESWQMVSNPKLASLVMYLKLGGI